MNVKQRSRYLVAVGRVKVSRHRSTTCRFEESIDYMSSVFDGGVAIEEHKFDKTDIPKNQEYVRLPGDTTFGLR